ncbi:hypothetical protein BH18ACT4_BH18ACT4_14680 [soil metagenome]
MSEPQAPVEEARPATDADLGWLAELARHAIPELASTKGGRVWARREARLESVDSSLAAAMSDDDQLVLAGTLDGVIVGYAAVRIERLRDGGRLGVVDDIYVEPDGRGVGLGEVLMDAIVTWCEERGCIGVDALALPGNRATKNFFEAFGLVARAIVVHRPLGNGGGDV